MYQQRKAKSERSVTGRARIEEKSIRFSGGSGHRCGSCITFAHACGESVGLQFGNREGLVHGTATNMRQAVTHSNGFRCPRQERSCIRSKEQRLRMKNLYFLLITMWEIHKMVSKPHAVKFGDMVDFETAQIM